jgi:hypothetical protein
MKYNPKKHDEFVNIYLNDDTKQMLKKAENASWTDDEGNEYANHPPVFTVRRGKVVYEPYNPKLHGDFLDKRTRNHLRKADPEVFDPDFAKKNPNHPSIYKPEIHDKVASRLTANEINIQGACAEARARGWTVGENVSGKDATHGVWLHDPKTKQQYVFKVAEEPNMPDNPLKQDIKELFKKATTMDDDEGNEYANYPTEFLERFGKAIKHPYLDWENKINNKYFESKSDKDYKKVSDAPFNPKLYRDYVDKRVRACAKDKTFLRKFRILSYEDKYGGDGKPMKYNPKKHDEFVNKFVDGGTYAMIKKAIDWPAGAGHEEPDNPLKSDIKVLAEQRRKMLSHTNDQHLGAKKAEDAFWTGFIKASQASNIPAVGAPSGMQQPQPGTRQPAQPQQQAKANQLQQIIAQIRSSGPTQVPAPRPIQPAFITPPGQPQPPRQMPMR